MTINEQLGKKIRDLRKEKGLTQKEFGEIFGLSQNAITNIETGKRALMLDELLNIANYFKEPTDYLIKENGIRGNNPDFQYICDYTGLNEQSVALLHTATKSDLDYINMLIRGFSHTPEITQIKESNAYLSSLYDELNKVVKSALEKQDKSKETEEKIKLINKKIEETTDKINGKKYSLNQTLGITLDDYIFDTTDSKIETIQKNAEIERQYGKYTIMVYKEREKEDLEKFKKFQEKQNHNS